MHDLIGYYTIFNSNLFILTQYYKSGFSQDDITCLKKGLVAMKTLLGSDHHLMANWKDFYTVFLRKVHTFEIMR